LAFCMLATGLFSSMSGLLYFSLAYFVALFAKSAGWPSMANLIRVWYPQHWRGRIWGILSSSSRFSSLFTTLVLGSLLLVVSWRGVIATAAVITCAVLLLLFLVLKQSPADVGLAAVAPSDGDNQQRPHPLDETTLAEALLRFARSARVWLICMSAMSLTVLMEFQSFIPIYLKETFGLTAGIAAITSSAFPMGCLISVLAGGLIFDLLSKKKRIWVLGGMMVCAVVCIGLLLALPNLGLTGDFGLWTALLAIMVYGLAIAPCYYIPMSVFAVDFGGAHCGVLVGIIDAVGYLAAMAFDFLGGAVADQVDGWHQFLNILLGVSLCGSVTLPLFLLLDYRSARALASS
ncbi:MAG: MFS transporter, partial [Planctomycetes bacterium]|nr:MFS transporter [Planctomycetota bacterium]